MTNDAQSEFKKISQQVFYFDTNVISYIYNHTKIIDESLKQKASIAYVLLAKFKELNNSAYPYSFAHLRDIYFGSEEYEISKIEELRQHSKCWKIQNDSNSQLARIDKCLDLDADFKYLKSGMNEAKIIQDAVYRILNPCFQKTAEQVFHDDMDSTSLDHINSIVEIIRNYNSNSTLELYRYNKKMRNTKVYWKGERIFFPTIDKSNIETSREELIIATDKAFSESSLEYSDHQSYFNLLDTIYKGKIEDPFVHEIMKISSLCDLFGISNEKLKKETAFEGIISDAFHLSFGLRSHYFVTEDKNLYTKALFTKKWMNLSGYILNLDSLIWILIQLMLNSGELKEKFSVENYKCEITVNNEGEQLAIGFNIKSA